MINKVMKDDVMHDINDKRIPEIAASDVGKFLSVDENGMLFKDVVGFDGVITLKRPGQYFVVNNPLKNGLFKLSYDNDSVGFLLCKLQGGSYYTCFIYLNGTWYRVGGSDSDDITLNSTVENMPVGFEKELSYQYDSTRQTYYVIIPNISNPRGVYKVLWNSSPIGILIGYAEETKNNFSLITSDGMSIIPNSNYDSSTGKLYLNNLQKPYTNLYRHKLVAKTGYPYTYTFVTKSPNVISSGDVISGVILNTLVCAENAGKQLGLQLGGRPFDGVVKGCIIYYDAANDLAEVTALVDDYTDTVTEL